MNLVLDLVLGRGAALGTSAALAALLLVTWVVFPLLRRRGDIPGPDPADGAHLASDADR